MVQLNCFDMRLYKVEVNLRDCWGRGLGVLVVGAKPDLLDG
jgi:hypothetical protein